MANEHYGGGLYRFQWWLRDSTGYFSGDQTTWANDATTHSIVMDGIVATDLAIRDVVTQPIRGGNGIIAFIQFGQTGLNNFTATFETVDDDHVALLHGTSVDSTTNTSYEISTTYTNAADVRSIGCIFTSQYTDRDGSSGYEHLVIPHARAIARRVSGGYQGVNTYVWAFAPIAVSTNYDGEAFSDWAINVPGGKLDHYKFKTPYPIAVTGYKSDGTETTFNTQYKPISTTVALGATPNWFARNGAYAALSSIVQASGLATMATAGSAADKNVLTYHTNLIAVA